MPFHDLRPSRLALLAVSATLTLTLAFAPQTVAARGESGPKAVKVEFTPTPAPATETTMLRTYTSSTARVTFADGSVREYPLHYASLFKNTDPVASAKGRMFPAGQAFDYRMEPILDPNGDPVVIETADANSLLKVGSKLLLVTNWEYDDVLANGEQAYRKKGWHTRMPMGMSLSEIAQSRDGSLAVVRQEPIDFSSVGGGWIFCFGSQTPWNTHLAG